MRREVLGDRVVPLSSDAIRRHDSLQRIDYDVGLPKEFNWLDGVACTVLTSLAGRGDNVNELPRFEYRVALLLVILILVLMQIS
jgi:hypothetical protein